MVHAPQVPDAWRVTNSADIIPSVPRLLGYAHVRHSVRLLGEGRMEVQVRMVGRELTSMVGLGAQRCL